jgi:hypothetical protein
MVSDAVARQTIDSTKLFKEYLRVRNELRRVPGSMFWKKVGKYEYLAHKVAGKVNYLGSQSDETLSKYESFSISREKIEKRYNSLKNEVILAERMNKALHAGYAPRALVDILRALDEEGLGDKITVIGSAALFAYTQKCGIAIKDVFLCGDNRKNKRDIVEDARKSFHLIVAGNGVSAIQINHALGINFKFASSEYMDTKKTKTSSFELHFRHNKANTNEQKNKNSASSPLSDWELKCVPTHNWLHIIQDIPKFEQVIIAQTGKMCLMRTVDPLLFVCMNHLFYEHFSFHEFDGAAPKIQTEFVSHLLKEHMIRTKVEPAEVESIRNIIASMK